MKNLYTYVAQFPWLDEFITILIYFTLAFLMAFLLTRISNQLMKLGRIAPKNRKPSPDREKTLQSLVSYAIKFLSFLVACIASFGLFIEAETLAWVFGLFSAAFGLGARPLISDYLTGLGFIFEDTFSVGEKIELVSHHQIEGLVESINLRATLLRAPSGELYVVPNGEIRTIRNFSRGKFSLANISLKISSPDIGNVLIILEALDKEAMHLLPNLIEPWQVISPEGIMGQCTELTIVAKARFGKAAEMRPRLLKLIHDKLTEADVSLID